MLEFETHIQSVIQNLFGKWDHMCSNEGQKEGEKGFDILDCEILPLDPIPSGCDNRRMIGIALT